MSQLTYNSALDTYVSWASQEATWAYPTQTNGLAPGYYSYKRRDTAGSQFDALHDLVEITDIKIEMTASHPGGYANMGKVYASFAGIAMDLTMASGSSTLYSANGGAGTLPATIRAANIESWVQNIDSFYTLQITCSQPLITITYIDNGQPAMLQFSL